MPPFTLYKSPIHPSNSKLCATHSRTHWTASITQDTIVYSFPVNYLSTHLSLWDLLTPLNFFLTNQRSLLHLRRILCQNPTERSGVLSLQLPLLSRLYFGNTGCLFTLYASHNRLSPEHSPMDTFPFCSAALVSPSPFRDPELRLLCTLLQVQTLHPSMALKSQILQM